MSRGKETGGGPGSMRKKWEAESAIQGDKGKREPAVVPSASGSGKMKTEVPCE